MMNMEIFWKIGALLVLVIFYSVYLGKMFLQKRQGIQTDQMGKKKEKSARKTIEIILKITTYSIIVVEVVSILSGYSMLGDHGKEQGLILGLIGDGIFTLAVLTMRDSWRAGIAEQDKTEMVTRGIYGWSRNPAFLGFDLVYLGILLMYMNRVLILWTIAAMIMMHLQILQEEKYLPTVFGEEYLDYKKKVFRYLGRRH